MAVFSNAFLYIESLSSAPSGRTTINAHGPAVTTAKKFTVFFRLKHDTIEPARECGRKLCSFLPRIGVRAHCRFVE